jgi:hypothetical protein
MASYFILGLIEIFMLCFNEIKLKGDGARAAAVAEEGGGLKGQCTFPPPPKGQGAEVRPCTLAPAGFFLQELQTQPGALCATQSPFPRTCRVRKQSQSGPGLQSDTAPTPATSLGDQLAGLYSALPMPPGDS